MAIILTVAFAFGAAVYAFDNKYLLVAIVIMFYLIVQKLLGWHHQQKYLSQTIIYHAGNVFKLKGFIDSGNSLVDPVSQLPVSIISLPVFLEMFPEITADKILLHELDEVITGGHYIDYKTISGKGKLFVFRPDKMQINGTKITDGLLGVAAKDFGNAKYDALLNVKLGGLLWI